MRKIAIKIGYDALSIKKEGYTALSGLLLQVSSDTAHTTNCWDIFHAQQIIAENDVGYLGW